MPRSFSVDGWIQIAKFTATAGEIAPFPYIKGAAGCVAMVLEVIEKAGKNDEDIQGLAENIGTTVAIIKETIDVHGITSATHFHDICADFQTYLENLLSELNKTQRNLERKRFHRFLKTRKVADAINGYKQRMNDIKANYIVSLMTDARLEMPEILREIQKDVREHTSHIFANLQNRKGYVKGEVRVLTPGDIYLLETEPHDHCHGYCTVESSNTVKLIRIYQPHIGNEEDVMKQLDHDIDVFIRPRHPNIAQVFGVCRSPNLPAIIFHVSRYTEHYAPENGTDTDLTGAYINEHGRLLVVGIFGTYVLDMENYAPGTAPFNTFWNQQIAEPRNLGRYLPYISVELPKMDLRWVYYAIFLHIRKKNLQLPYQQGQYYVPGSILTGHGQTLVGGVRDRSRLREWNVHWRGPSWSSGNPKEFIICLLSTDCGSIVIDPLVHQSDEPHPILEFKGNTIPILCAGTMPHDLEIHLRSITDISKSWIAQASNLDTSLRSREYIDEDGLYQIYGGFSLRIEPLDKHGEHFYLCDTFMAEDPHTLSLFICHPVVDYPSNKVSLPVLSWLYDADSEISLEEAENSFGFKLITSWGSWPSPCSSVFTAIPELHVECGFNPAKGCTDVCEHYGWPLLELFDTSKSMELEERMTSDAVSESLEPASMIISDGARQTSREEAPLAGSPQGDIMYMALERIDADEAATKTNIIAVVQRNIYLY
ncbi:hypothetical protein ARMGADRAFT_1040151 [Armillaria gallica]|uniref:Protein kinase domain-containing protein n=1 Tax=Armillaria gallica TaxID=47427 RepID=A0A2H3CG73_ARMGA|nr:hypothetical protein ARMGADRAFT_1040151 [Armillaria gallica]